MSDTKQTGTIWVDMTDMSTWRGHFTGTQRVTFEIASRLKQHQPQAAFFVYDESSKAFYPIDFQEITDRIKAAVQPVRASTSADTPQQSTKAALKAKALRTYHNLPPKLKAQFTPERKALLRRSLHGIQQAAKALRSSQPETIKTAAANSTPITFKPHDTVVILGKPWDTMSLIDVMRRQKISSGFRLINLIYDMIPVYQPHLFGQPLPQNYTSYMFEALSLSDEVIAISDSTKRDVIKFCKDQLLTAPPVRVTKLGSSFVDHADDNTVDNVADLQGKDFILSVGTIENRKNHILLYTAYRQAALQGQDLPTLVIVGNQGAYTGDVLYQFSHDPIIKSKVRIMQGVSDLELDWLYRNCVYTVYPSVYEGWGLPIAESLAYGKLCLASQTSSMPEVGGELIDYFSPYDSLGCLNLMVRYLDEPLRTRKEKQIKQAYKQVGWNEPYEQVVAAINNRS